VTQTVKYAAVADSQAGVGKFDFVSGFNVGAVAGGAATAATYTITAAQIAALQTDQVLAVTGSVTANFTLAAPNNGTAPTAASVAAQLDADPARRGAPSDRCRRDSFAARKAGRSGHRGRRLRAGGDDRR
jgi:hypothetical protein